MLIADGEWIDLKKIFGVDEPHMYPEVSGAECGYICGYILGHCLRQDKILPLLHANINVREKLLALP